jgi:ATP-dependent DNA ligase
VVPFVKIGSGYNSHEWSVLNQHLEHLLVPIKTATNLSMISDLKGADRPDLLVSNPQRSVVIQVKGSQLVASSTYKTLGMSLRFPRFIKLRLDRAGDSSMTEAELKKMMEITAGTMAAKSAKLGGIEEKPKRQVNRAKGKMSMVSWGVYRAYL